MPKPKRRSKKGSVQIVNRNGLLTLRLSYEGARHQRALGLPDTPINRELARRKACEVELDIASGNFDPTFDQYFPREAAPIARPTTLELWEQFIEHRRNAHTSEQAVASRSNKRSLVGMPHCCKPATIQEGYRNRIHGSGIRHPTAIETIRTYCQPKSKPVTRFWRMVH